jgi:hypothetical protein
MEEEAHVCRNPSLVRSDVHWFARASRCWIALVFAAAALGAQSALAAGTPFQRGDVLASVGGAINLYAPDGTLKDTFATGSGAGSLCFDPNGNHLIALHVGLFDSSGNLLPSNWASLPSSYGECAVDGFGNVYVAQGPYGGVSPNRWATIRKYDLTGNLLRSYTVSLGFSGYGFNVPNLDLAPDQCTLYYGGEGGGNILRFNACTNTQGAPSMISGPALDQLRVLPNWQVAVTTDYDARLFDTSGGLLRQSLLYGYGFIGGMTSLHWLSLDPGGHSLWIGSINGSAFINRSCGANTTDGVWRVDSNTGQVLANWSVACGNSLRGLAAYGPPLLGDPNIESTVDSNSAGTAEAFPTQVGYAGQLSRLHVYIDSSSTASRAVVGVYSDRNGIQVASGSTRRPPT